MSRWDIEINRRLAEAGLDPVREAEISRELAQHLDDRVRGAPVSRAAARRSQARTLDELKEADLHDPRAQAASSRGPQVPSCLATRDSQSLVSGAWQDIRYALRTLGASRGFTAVAVMTLALGIGATTAIFSVVDAMLIRPLSYDPDGRLVRVFRTVTERGKDGPSTRTIHLTPSIPPSKSGRRGETSSTPWPSSKSARSRCSMRRLSNALRAMAVTPRVLSPLRLDTAGHGSAVRREDTNATRYGHQRRLLAAPVRGGPLRSSVGPIRTVDGAKTVVGVLPAGFPYSPETDFWIPLLPNPTMMKNGRVGRDACCPPQRRDDSRAGQSTRWPAIRKSGGETARSPRWKARASRRFTNGSVKNSRQMLFILLAAVSCILLIACVNVASLLLARGSGRSREVAIRASLGAGRLRLARQFLTESIVLAMLGGVAGVTLAWLLLNALVTILPVTCRAKAVLHWIIGCSASHSSSLV